MKARELMIDSPDLNVLLERTLTQEYEVDPFDFFYMQGKSEQDRKRASELNPANGNRHWYGAAVCVAGGLLQKALRNTGHDEEVLRINAEIVRLNVIPEMLTLQGKPTQQDKGEASSMNLYALYKRFHRATKDAQPPIERLVKGVGRYFQSNAPRFLRLCKEGNEVVFDHVDFSSPVFGQTELFLPWKEQRHYTDDELERLDGTHLHEVYPFTAHLIHGMMLDILRKR